MEIAVSAGCFAKLRGLQKSRISIYALILIWEAFMPRKTKTERWVITSVMASSSGVPKSCYCKDGTSSDIRSHWVKFSTWDSAKEWATKNGIEIDGFARCIVPWDFEAHEL